MRRASGSNLIQEQDRNRVFTELYQEDEMYDAYEKDISAVTFFFESNTAFEFERNLRMTWIDLVSQIGGLLGLCLGFSLVSLVELVYWFTIRMAKNVI